MVSEVVQHIMASVKLQPPSPFNFQSPDEWPRWKRTFEQFCQASGLSSEDDSRQVWEDSGGRSLIHRHHGRGEADVSHRHRQVRLIFQSLQERDL